ncbi:MAG: amidohydrolase family protein [Gemmatimonadota bacterium]
MSRTQLALVLLIAAGCNRGKPVAADLVIENVTLIDGTDRPARPGMSVAVAAGEIVAVEEAGKLTVVPTAARVDGQGKFLIPGLWDMHVHLFGYREHSFPLFLANGVTTIRDVGGELASSLWLRQETTFGRILGPEMLIAGPTLDADYVMRAVKGTVYEPARAAIPDSAAAVRMVDSLGRVGVDQIKVHGMTPRAAYFAVLREAKKRGILVVGHIPDSVTATEAIEAGQRTIEHNSRVPEAESGREAEITRVTLAAMQRAINAAGSHPRIGPIFQLRMAAFDSAIQSFDPVTASAFADLAAKRDVWFDPTLVVMEALFRINEPEVHTRPETVYVPRAGKDFDEGFSPKPNPTAADIAEGRREWKNMLVTFKPLIKAGVKFVAGTDVPVLPLVPGFALQRELGLLVEAGLSPLQAIQAATRNAADASGKLHTVGTVEKGKRADLVLLDADPLADIHNTGRIRAVISRGRLLDRATLDRMLRDAEAFARQP